MLHCSNSRVKKSRADFRRDFDWSEGMTTKSKTANPADMFMGAFDDVYANGRQNFEGAMKASTEATEQAVRAGADAFSAQYSKAIEASKEGLEASFKAFGEVNVHDKASSDAIVAAGKAAADGSEKIGNEILSYSKSAMDEYFKMTKAMVGAKNLKDAAEVQSSYAKSAFEAYVKESNKISALGLEVARSTVEPISGRFAFDFEKFFKQTDKVA
jgi:hypothetical protein